MKIEIKHRWNGSDLYTAEIPDDTPEEKRIAVALTAAIKAGADLAGADLADLREQAALQAEGAEK